MVLNYDAYNETLAAEERSKNMEKQVNTMQSQLQNLVTALRNMSGDSKNNFAKELFCSGVLEIENK
jgi:hypothetical protein